MVEAAVVVGKEAAPSAAEATASGRPVRCGGPVTGPPRRSSSPCSLRCRDNATSVRRLWLFLLLYAQCRLSWTESRGSISSIVKAFGPPLAKKGPPSPHIHGHRLLPLSPSLPPPSPPSSFLSGASRERLRQKTSLRLHRRDGIEDDDGGGVDGASDDSSSAATTADAPKPAGAAPSGGKFQQRNQRWVVIVDDEEPIRLAVGDFLYDAGYQVTACSDADSMLDLLLLSPPGGSDGALGDGVYADDDNPNDLASTTTSSTAAGGRGSNANGRGTSDDSSSSSVDGAARTTRTNKHQRREQRQLLPDAIISDIRMPGSSKNGYELVQSIRSDSRLSKIPIILLTAKAMTQDRIQGYQSGADVFLPKPFAPEELLSILDNLIERKEQRTATTTSAALLGADTASAGGSSRNSPDASELMALKQDLDDIKEIMKRNAAATVRKTNVSLTDAERRVLELVCDGYTNSEIAFERGVGVVAINRTVQKLYEETKTRSRTELVKWAVTTGYVPP